LYSDEVPAQHIITDPEHVPVEQLEHILASPDFGGTRERWALRLKKPIPQQEPSDPVAGPDNETVRLILGYTLLAVIVASAAGLLVFLARWMFAHRKSLRGSLGQDKAVITPASTDISTGDLLYKAREYLSQGSLRAAWACCVRAAVSQVAGTADAVPRRSYTELEILNIASANEISGLGEFSLLIHQWLEIAYAGKEPEHDTLVRHIQWCESLEADHGGAASG
ncbi:MAG: hypothetical protein JXB03_08940, partial [Spirochaetales bacterium]|nr:hypothetical protein [Spirochaetales bacterium]